MATKKYLSLTGLTEYDALIKGEITEGDEATLTSANSYTDTEVAKKADSGHTHDGRYYTESEIDSKLSTINTSIANITSGTVVVKEAEHATSADTAGHATTAGSATSAETATTASKLGTTTVGSSTQPIYLNNGAATTCSTYAGGTKVTLNGSGKGGSSASFYAPTGAGTKGNILTSNGSGAPTWANAETARTNLEVYSTSEVDTALSGKSDTSHNHNSAYDAKGAASEALASAQSYTDGKISALLDGATDTTLDSIKELADAIKNNDSAIDALNDIAAGKAAAEHTHEIADVTGLQTALDGKAAASHGTHVSFDSTNKPKMDGTAAFGTSTKVARADHVHPTDTTRAAQTDLDALTTTVSGKADAEHTHAIADVTNLQTTLNSKQATITGGASSITTNNLTVSRALVSDANGKVAVSAVTSTELGYLDGVTSAIQAQIDGKAASDHIHSDATTSAAGFMTAAMVTKLNGIATGANKTVVDTALSSSSTNPVQNKVVNSAISTLTSSVSANTSSISAHTTSINALQTAIDEITDITSAEISALFA